MNLWLHVVISTEVLSWDPACLKVSCATPIDTVIQPVWMCTCDELESLVCVCVLKRLRFGIVQTSCGYPSKHWKDWEYQVSLNGKEFCVIVGRITQIESGFNWFTCSGVPVRGGSRASDDLMTHFSSSAAEIHHFPLLQQVAFQATEDTSSWPTRQTRQWRSKWIENWGSLLKWRRISWASGSSCQMFYFDSNKIKKGGKKTTK